MTQGDMEGVGQILTSYEKGKLPGNRYVQEVLAHHAIIGNCTLIVKL